MFALRPALFTSLALLTLFARADVTIYTDGSSGLAAGWENWSWGSTVDFAAKNVTGKSAISVVSAAYSALSVYDETTFANDYAGLRFDVAAASTPDVSLYLTSTTSNANSISVPFSALTTSYSLDKFTTVTVDFKALPPSGAVLPADSWNRITFQSGGNGASYLLDNISLLTEIVITPKFLSAEPLLGNLIAVTSQGAVDFSSISVKLNGAAIAVTSKISYSPPDTPSKTITYLTLAKNLAQGTLSITSGSTSYTYTLPAVEYGTITTGVTTPISSDIYGVNFPTDSNYIKTLGASLSRWGGNAVTAYNPFGQFTNAGNDWFFENRVADPPDADSWMGWVKAAGSKTLLTIPALDWVSKDSTSYSYPKDVYPNQSKFDPYGQVQGSGQYPNGSWVPPPDPRNVYTAWNTTLAAKWLTGLKNKPDIVAVDNEIEIASNTHQDMHPVPMGYDEELKRVLATATMAKTALPNVQVAAPSTCAWWFYWTSSVGYTDNAAHNNIDFLPWFLAQMKTASDKAGKRLLDYLDIHYYFAPDVSANDAAANALKMRMTRSLWDPQYTDESYIGTSVPAQWHQPNPNQVWLIPRMKAMIAQLYPGTKLSISEWAAPDNGITGGLVTADSLGIFGRYGVDAATYWATPDIVGGPGLAYWLYRGASQQFGSSSVQVSMSKNNTDVLGVYAGATSGKNISLVLINKDTVPISLSMSNIPAGKYFVKHFGGASGVAKWQTTVTLSSADFLVVPAYTAVFLRQQ